MKLIRQIADIPDSLRGCAVTIGNFDGVHRGHAVLIKELKLLAERVKGASIVFTFDPHPVRILRPAETPPPLTWTNRKADLLAKLGVDAVVAYPTDRALLSLGYQEFFSQIVLQALGAKAMVEGPNFFFGRAREGNTRRLRALCDQENVELKIVEPTIDGTDLISSSRIRDLIQAGNVGDAASMLTQPYRIRGMVTHGAARGGKIGFPTANLDAIDTLVPGLGVYAGRSYIDGKAYWSAIHVGPNPTFGELHRKVESHLLGFEGSIYGKPIEVDFVARLRDIHRFDSAEELIKQLKSDVETTRAISIKCDGSRAEPRGFR